MERVEWGGDLNRKGVRRRGEKRGEICPPTFKELPPRIASYADCV